MITVSLNEIRARSPCEDGWRKVLQSKGGTSADMDAKFPLSDIIDSNGIDDALWTLRCRPEHSRLWRKFAVWAARQVEHLIDDERSRNALDVAWRHSDGAATDEELAAARRAARGAARDAARDAAWDAARDAAWAAAWDAAWDAARDAARGAARDAAWDAAMDAARGAQSKKLREILTAGEWVE